MEKGPAKRASAVVARAWRKALRNEVEGVEFYRMAADAAILDGARQIFAFLMKEEERHRDAILEQIRRTEAGRPLRLARTTAARKEARRVRDSLFTPELLPPGTRVEGEAAVLSIGMDLEKRSIAQFSALRKLAGGDASVEKVFDDLIAWEREHLAILVRQYGQLREVYWEEARFWPF